MKVDSNLEQRILRVNDSFESFFQKLAIDKYLITVGVFGLDCIRVTATNSFALFDSSNFYSIRRKFVYGGFFVGERPCLVIGNNDTLDKWLPDIFTQRDDSVVLPCYRLLYQSIPSELLYRRYQVSYELQLNAREEAYFIDRIDSTSMNDFPR